MPVEAGNEEILYVDVSLTWGSDTQTGIQRVVRQLVSNWHLSGAKISLVIFSGGVYRVLPNTALASFEKIYSSRLPKSATLRLSVWNRLLAPYKLAKPFLPTNIIASFLRTSFLQKVRRKRWQTWIPAESAVFNPNNAQILLLDLVLDLEQIDYLKRVVAENGARLNFFCYDSNPITYPQYFPSELPEIFEDYISLAKYSERVWSISKSAQDDLIKVANLDMSESSFAYKWLPPFDFLECQHSHLLANYDEKDDFILMVASFVPSKNHLGFFQALENLNLQGVRIPKIFLVGGMSWREDEIDSGIQRLSNQGIHIEKFKNLPDCCVGKLYKSCSFVVLPSFIEGFGLPIVEGLNFGKPVVTSTSTSMGELLDLPGTVGFSHAGDPTLETVLRRILGDGEFLRELAVSAKANGENLGSWPEYAAAVLNFITNKPEESSL